MSFVGTAIGAYETYQDVLSIVENSNIIINNEVLRAVAGITVELSAAEESFTQLGGYIGTALGTAAKFYPPTADASWIYTAIGGIGGAVGGNITYQTQFKVDHKDALIGALIDGRQDILATSQASMSTHFQSTNGSTIVVNSGNVDYGLSGYEPVPELTPWQVLALRDGLYNQSSGGGNQSFPSDAVNDSNPTPNSFLYFLESLPEGGVDWYDGKAYLKTGDSVQEVDPATLDNDFYYIPPVPADPSVGNPDNLYNAANSFQTGDYFSYGGVVYRKGLGDEYEVAQFTDNDGNYTPPTEISYLTEAADGNIVPAAVASSDDSPLEDQVVAFLTDTSLQNELADFFQNFGRSLQHRFGFDEDGNFILFDGELSELGANGLGSVYGDIIADTIYVICRT